MRRWTTQPVVESGYIRASDGLSSFANQVACSISRSFCSIPATFQSPSYLAPIACYKEYRFRGSGTLPPIQMYPTYVVLFHSLIKLLLADLGRKFAGRPCDTYNIELVYELNSSTVQRLRQHEVIPWFVSDQMLSLQHTTYVVAHLTEYSRR